MNLTHKLIALLIAISLWSIVNFGSRTAVSVSRYVQIENAKEDFVYKIEPERVIVTIYVVERLLLSEFVDKVRAYVDVRNIDKEGRYKLKVLTETKAPVLVHPSAVDPSEVIVIVRKAPERGKRELSAAE